MKILLKAIYTLLLTTTIITAIQGIDTSTGKSIVSKVIEHIFSDTTNTTAPASVTTFVRPVIQTAQTAQTASVATAETAQSVFSTIGTSFITAGKIASFATKSAIALAAATCLYKNLTPDFLQTPINKRIGKIYTKIRKEFGDIIPSEKDITDFIGNSFGTLEDGIKTTKKLGKSVISKSLTMAKNAFYGLTPLALAYLALKYLP